MTFFILGFLLTKMTLAAPHPTTGSSILNQINTSTAFSQLGFRLNNIPAGWTLTESTRSEDNKNQKQLDLKKHKARLSFNYDETKGVANLENFVKKFLRDYNQFGFEVSGLQSLKSNKQSSSIILDLHQKNKKTRGRQVFFQNGKKIVTATCVDDFETFDKSVEDCNKILGSFYWE